MPSKGGPSRTKTAPSHTEPTPAEIANLQDALIKRLLQSGEWERYALAEMNGTIRCLPLGRISSALKDRLTESGWTDETYHQAKGMSLKEGWYIVGLILT
jgi:hypothetical protein